MKNKVAIGVFSGGLDSWISALLIKKQGFDIKLVHFVSPFFGLKGSELESLSNKVKEFSMDLIVHYLGMDYVSVLQAPKYGIGKGINPCTDCHLHMMRLAKHYMDTFKASFVFTGEVIGQRPMSQTKSSLKLIEDLSGLKGFLLRPLSALYLEPTKPELDGTIDRSKLLSITGRSRKEQTLIAGSFNLTDYPHPGGGCKLTHPDLRNKFKNITSNFNIKNWDLINLINLGRHFELGSGLTFVLSRDEPEDKFLYMQDHLGLKVYLKDYLSSVGLILFDDNLLNENNLSKFFSKTNNDLEVIAKIIKRYSKANPLYLENINLKFENDIYNINTVENVLIDNTKEIDTLLLKL